MTDPSIHPASRKVVIVMALLFTLFGGFLRFYKLSNQSFWTDEIYSMQAARAPLDQIAALSAFPNNSLPTYFLILRAAVGTSNDAIEFKARLVSALAGTFSIAVFIGLVYRWRRRIDEALAAGLFLAVNPLHIWYSQEARAYSITLFFGILCLLFFEIARERRRAGWWISYFLCAAFSIALHKTAIIFPAACLVWHGWDVWKKRQPWAILSIHLLILVLGVTVLSAKSIKLNAESLRPMSGLELPYTLLAYSTGYSFGPSLAQIQAYGPRPAILLHKFEMGVAAGLLLLLTISYSGNWSNFLSNKAAALFFLNLAMVFGYAYISKYPFNVRYTLPALLGFLGLAAGLAAGIDRSRLARAALAAFLVVSLWADFQWYYLPIYRKEDARALAQWLIENRDRFSSGVLAPGHSGSPVRWYLTVSGHPEINARFYFMAASERISFPPTPDLLIIGRRDHILQPSQLIADYQAATGNPTKVASFTGYDVFARTPFH